MPEVESRPAGAEEDSKKSGKFTWWEFFKVAALPIVTVIVGYFFNAAVDERQARESFVRLYADITGRQEEADSALRKDMFQSILNSFLTPEAEKPRREYFEQEVLNIELLANNFPESLEVGPLFKRVQRELMQQEHPDDDLIWRLNSVAESVIDQQLGILSDKGRVARGDIDLNTDPPSLVGTFGTSTVPLGPRQTRAGPTLCMSIDSPNEARHYRQLKLIFLDFNRARRELEIDLMVSRLIPKEQCERILDPSAEEANIEIDTRFWVGPFAFPMIDNIHLSDRERCAVSVVELLGDEKNTSSGRIAVSYYPASGASLKDKMYYDEVLHDLLKNRVVETRDK